MTAQFNPTDMTSMLGSTYKGQIDANFMALLAAACFQPYADPTPAMHIKVAAGGLNVAGAPVVEPVQTCGTLTAPVTHPRIDRIVIDATTAAISVVAGMEAVSPVPPAVPAGKLPCAQILLQTSTVAIVNGQITDERIMMPGIATTVTASAPLSASAGPAVALSLGTVGAPNGGTGKVSNTSGSLLLGAGTGAMTELAPGSAGNVATSDGSKWTSAAFGTTTFNTIGSYSIGKGISLPSVGSTASASLCGVVGGSGTWRNMGYITTPCCGSGIAICVRTA